MYGLMEQLQVLEASCVTYSVIQQQFKPVSYWIAQVLLWHPFPSVPAALAAESQAG